LKNKNLKNKQTTMFDFTHKKYKQEIIKYKYGSCIPGDCQDLVLVNLNLDLISSNHSYLSMECIMTLEEYDLLEGRIKDENLSISTSYLVDIPNLKPRTNSGINRVVTTTEILKNISCSKITDKDADILTKYGHAVLAKRCEWYVRLTKIQ
jgi:hypothetical protein